MTPTLDATTRPSHYRASLLLLAATAALMSCVDPVAPTTPKAQTESAVKAASRPRAVLGAPYAVDAATMETRFWNSAPWYVDCGYYACWAPGFPGVSAPASTFDALPRTVSGYTNTPVALPSLTCGTMVPGTPPGVDPSFPGGTADIYDNCLRNPAGTHTDVATRYRVLISGGTGGVTLGVRFGVDFMGGAMLVNGKIVASNWNDPSWWGIFVTDVAPCDTVTGICATPAVWVSDPASTLETRITVPANRTSVLEVIGFENGADYGAGVQFVGADSVWRDAISNGITMPLTVKIGASGGGHVTGPAGINCPGACTGAISWGTRPVLTPVPDTYFALSGWSGGCTGTGVCEPLMDAATTVTASFQRTQWPVTVTVGGTGTGRVTSTPVGLDCSTGSCTAGFNVGSTVTLTAAPGPGSVTSWSGCPSVSGNSCTLRNLGSATAVTATFTQTATQLFLSTPATAIDASGVPFATQPVVTIQDAAGATVTASTATVTMTARNSSGVAVATATATASAGVATFSGAKVSGLAGAYTLTFSSGTLTTTSQPITLTAGPASQMAIFAGNNQTATVGSAVSIAPSVVVKDAAGNPVAGVAVVFAVMTGGGTATPTSAVSSASGVAAVGSWTLGSVAGPNTLSATSAGLAGSPVTFTAIATVAGGEVEDYSCKPSPKTLWPVNHKLVDIRVELPDGAFALDSVTSSEPMDAKGDGKTLGDIVGWDVGTADVRGQLRAERAGDKKDRVYTLRYSGSDEHGRRATATCRVTVPHDQDRED